MKINVDILKEIKVKEEFLIYFQTLEKEEWEIMEFLERVITVIDLRLKQHCSKLYDIRHILANIPLSLEQEVKLDEFMNKVGVNEMIDLYVNSMREYPYGYNYYLTALYGITAIILNIAEVKPFSTIIMSHFFPVPYCMKLHTLIKNYKPSKMIQDKINILCDKVIQTKNPFTCYKFAVDINVSKSRQRRLLSIASEKFYL